MTMATYAWAPTTQQVASYVTSRTVDYDNPGNDTPKGDFTASTYPTVAQVRQMIEGSCDWVHAEVGEVAQAYVGLAATVAAIHTAALVEASFPVRDADIASTAQTLFDEAHRHLQTLKTANITATGVPGDLASTLLPVYSFPDPPWYGDRAL